MFNEANRSPRHATVASLRASKPIAPFAGMNITERKQAFQGNTPLTRWTWGWTLWYSARNSPACRLMGQSPAIIQKEPKSLRWRRGSLRGVFFFSMRARGTSPATRLPFNFRIATVHCRFGACNVLMRIGETIPISVPSLVNLPSGATACRMFTTEARKHGGEKLSTSRCGLSWTEAVQSTPRV